MLFKKHIITPLFLLLLLLGCGKKETGRERLDFTTDWKFKLADNLSAEAAAYPDSSWRTLDVPHDWSIEGEFSESHPATAGGGALPGGTGWYRKTFTLPESDKDKKIFIAFDGVYRNSEVWINGHLLGKRPNGYISFEYELTPHLHFGNHKNVIAVKVDNSQQPNSRWYSGSGIYRNVWLIKTGAIHVTQFGTVVRTSDISELSAKVTVATTLRNTVGEKEVTLETILYDSAGKKVATAESKGPIGPDTVTLKQTFTLDNPALWSVEKPALYKAISYVSYDGKLADSYETTFGIRSFEFDSAKGFSLNGKPMKILGVCNHHDLGALGAAINTRALERQLEIMKAMGVNGIRTSHNPPAPELLDLCDKMGFIVMDEMFDMWKMKKSDYDYSQYWDEWHKRDLEDFIRRDRNHASVFIWSIGNEIPEQWDSTGSGIAKELATIVRALDASRPITTGNNEPTPKNSIVASGAVDLIGYNYHSDDFATFPQRFPGKKFIGTETVSALETRGYYDMPSDSVRKWPISWDKLFTQGNPGNTVSAYDNVQTPWGSTHEATWKELKKHDFLSGMYIWTGFDYLGEPTPYVWPSRSSYFGIVDLAGFPKDVYYMYQSEWTNTPVLHILPHWNWTAGKTIDVWAYYNQADEVELFLNGASLGVRRKEGDDLHVMWRLTYQPGTLKAVSRKDGRQVLTKEIHTTGKAVKIVLEPDRTALSADGKDLSFITVKLVDEKGNVVPTADNTVAFDVQGAGTLAAVDNGDPVSHESFVGKQHKVMAGLALAVVRANAAGGNVTLTASGEGLVAATVTLQATKH